MANSPAFPELDLGQEGQGGPQHPTPLSSLEPPRGHLLPSPGKGSGQHSSELARAWGSGSGPGWALSCHGSPGGRLLSLLQSHSVDTGLQEA